ncbi:MAG: hypothetical protein HQL46_05515 [Gammaproteobacteria bacterium]|nr:hypothetical protein [Gammaproteobacteria bacterium]
MLVEGPLKLQIIEEDGKRELHITFQEDYQQLDLQNRVSQMRQHLTDLHNQYNLSNDAAEQQGMQMIIQVVSQIIPLIESDQMATDETIILELGKTSSINNIINVASAN